MSAKEIKAALKDVREAIKNKENNVAIKKCEEILKEDPENYMGLVLMGAAYQDRDKTKAAKYLRKAVSCSTDPTVALQGLANCAEWDELPDIFKKLLKLVPDKYADYHNKILFACEYSRNLKTCIEILRSEYEDSEDQTRKNSALKILAKILISQKEIVKDWEDLVKPAFKSAVDDKEFVNRLEYYKRYLKQLYKLAEYETLMVEASKMSEEFPKEMYPLEWICKVYSENYKSKTDVIQKSLSKPVELYAEQLLILNKTSIMGLLVKAIKHFETEQFVTARDLLQAIKELQPNLLLALELLGFTYMKIGAYGIAANTLKHINTSSVEMAICLSYSQEPEKLQRAIEILSSQNSCIFEGRNIDAICSLIRSYSSLNQISNALEAIEKVKNLGENENIIKLLQALNASTHVESLKILSEIDESYFDANLLKGKILFQSKDYDNALEWLLKATKQKPYYSDCFLWLGQVYYANNDFARAKKCYEKCANLNPHNETAVIHLSAMYKENEEWDLNEKLLQNSMKYLEGKESKWALFQLGLHYLSVKKYDDAIHYFRTSLRFDLKNIICWEGLADSYQFRGSFNSAMRVYQKIIEIDPENCYARLQVGVTKLTLHMYREAIDCFNELLKDFPDYIPALKGAAEANYGLANKLLTQRLIGRCKDHLQEAANHLQRVFLVGKRDMIWLWRMIANVFVMAACLPISKAFLNVSGKLAGQEEDVIVLERKELFEFAARFYTCALKLQSENGFLWHDLSICYYKFGIICKDNDMKLKYLKLALDTSKQSIKIQASRWQNWNLFGVINATREINDLALAQHSFITSLQLEKQSAISWTNLGVLYLTQNEIKLANQAFQKAQQSNPSYVNAWIGQAIIAEKIAEDEEAMDLFRHCTQLEFHVESALGYAHWVCSVLSNPENLKDPRYQYAIEKMHAVPVALDSMNWYIAAEDIYSCIESLTYLGFLNAKLGLWKQAIKAYKAAVKLATSAEKDKLLCNLGFAYLKNNQNEEAIEAFSSVAEATLKSSTGLALSYFNAERYEESYSVYNSALEWLAVNEEEKAVLLAAMTPIIYAAHGENDTKTVLFQCLALSNAPIQALFAACALGILHKDFELSGTILQELRPKENSTEHCHHIAFLTTQFFIANKQFKEGLIYLLKRVHIFPDNPLLRAILTNYLLQNYRKSKCHLSAACQIAQGAMILGLTDTKRKTSLEAAKCLILASKAMRHVDRKKQIKLAQRAVHLHPTCEEAWGALSKARC